MRPAIRRFLYSVFLGFCLMSLAFNSQKAHADAGDLCIGGNMDSCMSYCYVETCVITNWESYIGRCKVVGVKNPLPSEGCVPGPACCGDTICDARSENSSNCEGDCSSDVQLENCKNTACSPIPDGCCPDQDVMGAPKCQGGNSNLENYDVDCRSECIQTCGDGLKNGTEACDPTATTPGCPANSQCNNQCQCDPIPPVCRDHVLEIGEECDESLSTTCEKNGMTGTCHDCSCQVCGNGQVEGTEECDGGEDAACTVQAKRCNSVTCQCETMPEPTPSTPSQPSIPSSTGICGDGHIDSDLGEACDEGPSNGATSSSCSATCQPTSSSGGTHNPTRAQCALTGGCSGTDTAPNICSSLVVRSILQESLYLFTLAEWAGMLIFPVGILGVLRFRKRQ